MLVMTVCVFVALIEYILFIQLVRTLLYKRAVIYICT